MYYNIKLTWKKLKPGLVASYDIQPGNGEGLFWFRRFINLSLTYLDTYPLTYSPGTHMGADVVSNKLRQYCRNRCNLQLTVHNRFL